MTRRMVQGEKLFRLRLKKLCAIANCDPRLILGGATALVRAVREDCAKVAENTPYKLCDGCARHLAAAIRGKGEK